MKAKIPTIRTIKELKEVLKNHETMGFLDIMKSIDIPYDEFERHFTWNDGHYTRNSIVKNGEYELLVICWEQGQDSPIHDYDSEEAWIHIIRGKIKEEKYKLNKQGLLERVSTVTLGPQDFSFISGKVGLHRYVNTNEGRTVSLHLYVKPLFAIFNFCLCV